MAHDDGYVGDVYNPECSARDVLDIVASKWVLMILPLLRTGPMRTMRIRASVPGISMKVLTQCLLSLERHGLVARTEYSTARPHVEYALTDLGESLCEVLEPVDRWAERNFRTIDAAVERFDSALAKRPAST